MPHYRGMHTKKHPIAVLTAQINKATVDGWQQLLPKGEFRSRDGSPHDVPHWYIDEHIATRLIDRLRALKQDALVDYEHESILKAKKGEGAGAVLAAGWFGADEMRWFDDDTRQGLFIKPRWTPKAHEHIKNGEFAFLSAVFPYDEKGEPLEIRMAALTNDPGVTGMQRLAVLSAQFYQPENQPKEKTMDLLKQLLSKLGIDVPEGAEINEEQAKKALEALETLLSAKANAEGQVATLSAKVNDVDLSKYVPKATYDATVQQLAVLSAKTNETDVAGVIAKARNDGRVMETEVEYLTGFGKQQGVAALSAMLDARPKLAVLSAQQTENLEKPKEQGVAVLSADEKTVAKLLGMSEEDFAKQKEAK